MVSFEKKIFFINRHSLLKFLKSTLKVCLKNQKIGTEDVYFQTPMFYFPLKFSCLLLSNLENHYSSHSSLTDLHEITTYNSITKLISWTHIVSFNFLTIQNLLHESQIAKRLFPQLQCLLLKIKEKKLEAIIMTKSLLFIYMYIKKIQRTYILFTHIIYAFLYSNFDWFFLIKYFS